MAGSLVDRDDPLAWHQRLVTSLLQGNAFDVLPAERRLVQTHVSSVIVAGGYAYKLRKPLKLPFLDFSTPALRRADCDEELRLNRRTAPALYLDVLPVTGSVDAPRIGGDGPVLDWLLRLQRFDETQQFDRLADAGRLDDKLVDALALAVARFHAALPPSPAAFGQPATVRAWALDNFETLATLPAAAPFASRLAALRRWTEEACARLAPTLAQRRAAGFVREGHGDLHLGNIVLIGGQPLLFDALEFNAELRHTDVVADIAFTFMDLQRRGRPEAAWRFASLWAEHTGDVAGLVLLRFFAVYRAVVRAKVALLRGEQGDTGAAAAFEHDIALAERLAAGRAAAPRLVLTHGLSGAGKSRVAALLAPLLGAVRLRSDVERKRLHHLAPTERPDAAMRETLYGAEATRRTFEHLATLAGTLLQGGVDVVVDAAFLRRAERERFRELATGLGASFTIVACIAPEPELRQRLQRRTAAGDDASDATTEVLDLQLRIREPLAPDEGAITLDTATDATTLAQRCRALAARLGGA